MYIIDWKQIRLHSMKKTVFSIYENHESFSDSEIYIC